MGARRVRTAFVATLVVACSSPAKPTPIPPTPLDPVVPDAPAETPPDQATGANAPPATPPITGDKVVADFEAAVLASRDAYVDLFDFDAVGEYEILLRRYDLLGRLELTEKDKKEYAAEDGTPYPAARERRNVGNFYPILAQRTVGTGGCKVREPRTQYAKLLGTFDALPDETPPNYDVLRTHAVDWLAKGGVVAFACSGGNGGLSLVWTQRANTRGYDLITIYDD